MTYTPDQLKDILERHAKWLRNQEGARGADLSCADLSRADLSRADLSGADLSGADLSGANLSGADLRGADLSGAYLSGADLSGADLSRADLSRADLSRAYLSRAYLSRAVHAWAQVAFASHGECGRMLTAVIYKEGDAAVYQCGCFSGSLADMQAYIDNGAEKYKPSRTRAMEVVTELLNITREQ
jgi:hypothetical protein